MGIRVAAKGSNRSKDSAAPKHYPPLIFISHKRGEAPIGDDEFSVKLYLDLRAHFGDEPDVVWYDTEGGVVVGDDFENVIIKEIKQRPFFLVILSPNAMTGYWVPIEVETAFLAQSKRPKEPRRIFPIEYLPTEIPDRLAALRDIPSHISFVAPRPYAEALAELESALDKALADWQNYQRGRRMRRTLWAGAALLGVLLILAASFVRWWQPGPAATVCAPSGAAQAGTWGNAGNILVGRTDFNAVTLANGQALIAGGTIPVNGLGGFTTDSELYNPTTCAWRRTGKLVTADSLYGETTLTDGRVIIAGGYGPVLSTVQLYDPGAGVWSSAPALANARDEDTATRLVNGDILVTGGWDGFQMDSVEIEDLSTGVWQQAAPMLLARALHQAILLSDGRVLVMGGIGGVQQNGVQTAECEIYDPATNTWTVTGSMHTPRSTFAAVLLPSGNVLVAGGDTLTGLTSSAELYDPVTGKWTVTGSMHNPRSFSAGQNGVILANNNVLAAGGDVQGTSEEYNPTTGTWATPVKMRAPHCHAAVTLLADGRALIVGGDNCVNQMAQTLTSEVYTPKS